MFSSALNYLKPFRPFKISPTKQGGSKIFDCYVEPIGCSFRQILTPNQGQRPQINLLRLTTKNLVGLNKVV